ncbi:hypothetical protein BgiBS90_024809 [Biomphalaria glabrata]|nr:hypothetical protein BgiBS90_024809 [Biomphalaria glabrata]
MHLISEIEIHLVSVCYKFLTETEPHTQVAAVNNTTQQAWKAKGRRYNLPSGISSFSFLLKIPDDALTTIQNRFCSVIHAIVVDFHQPGLNDGERMSAFGGYIKVYSRPYIERGLSQTPLFATELLKVDPNNSFVGQLRVIMTPEKTMIPTNSTFSITVTIHCESIRSIFKISEIFPILVQETILPGDNMQCPLVNITVSLRNQGKSNVVGKKRVFTHHFTMTVGDVNPSTVPTFSVEPSIGCSLIGKSFIFTQEILNNLLEADLNDKEWMSKAKAQEGTPKAKGAKPKGQAIGAGPKANVKGAHNTPTEGELPDAQTQTANPKASETNSKSEGDTLKSQGEVLESQGEVLESQGTMLNVKDAFPKDESVRVQYFLLLVIKHEHNTQVNFLARCPVVLFQETLQANPRSPNGEKLLVPQYLKECKEHTVLNTAVFFDLGPSFQKSRLHAVLSKFRKDLYLALGLIRDLNAKLIFLYSFMTKGNHPEKLEEWSTIGEWMRFFGGLLTFSPISSVDDIKEALISVLSNYNGPWSARATLSETPYKAFRHFVKILICRITEMIDWIINVDDKNPERDQCPDLKPYPILDLPRVNCTAARLWSGYMSDTCQLSKLVLVKSFVEESTIEELNLKCFFWPKSLDTSQLPTFISDSTLTIQDNIEPWNTDFLPNIERTDPCVPDMDLTDPNVPSMDCTGSCAPTTESTNVVPDTMCTYMSVAPTTESTNIVPNTVCTYMSVAPTIESTTIVLNTMCTYFSVLATKCHYVSLTADKCTDVSLTDNICTDVSLTANKCTDVSVTATVGSELSVPSVVCRDLTNKTVMGPTTNCLQNNNTCLDVQACSFQSLISSSEDVKKEKVTSTETEMKQNGNECSSSLTRPDITDTKTDPKTNVLPSRSESSNERKSFKCGDTTDLVTPTLCGRDSKEMSKTTQSSNLHNDDLVEKTCNLYDIKELHEKDVKLRSSHHQQVKTSETCNQPKQTITVKAQSRNKNHKTKTRKKNKHAKTTQSSNQQVKNSQICYQKRQDQTETCNQLNQEQTAETCNQLNQEQTAETCNQLNQEQTAETCNQLNQEQTAETCNQLNQEQIAETCNQLNQEQTAETCNQLKQEQIAETCNQLNQKKTGETCNQLKQTQTETCNQLNQEQTAETCNQLNQEQIAETCNQLNQEKTGETCNQLKQTQTETCNQLNQEQIAKTCNLLNQEQTAETCNQLKQTKTETCNQLNQEQTTETCNQLKQTQTETCNQLNQEQTTETCSLLKQVQNSKTCNQLKQTSTVKAQNRKHHKTSKKCLKNKNARITQTCNPRKQVQTTESSNKLKQTQTVETYNQLNQEQTAETCNQLNQEQTAETCNQLKQEQTAETCNQLNQEQTAETCNQLKQEQTAETCNQLNQENTDETCNRLHQEQTAELCIQLKQEQTAEICNQLEQIQTVEICNPFKQNQNETCNKLKQEQTSEKCNQLNETQSAETCSQLKQAQTSKTCNQLKKTLNVKALNRNKHHKTSKTRIKNKNAKNTQTCNPLKQVQTAESSNEIKQVQTTQSSNEPKQTQTAESTNEPKQTQTAETYIQLNQVQTETCDQLKQTQTAESSNEPKQTQTAETYIQLNQVQTETCDQLKQTQTAESSNEPKQTQTAETYIQLNQVQTETRDQLKQTQTAESSNEPKQNQAAETYIQLNQVQTETCDQLKQTQTAESSNEPKQTQTAETYIQLNQVQTETCNQINQVQTETCDQLKQTQTAETYIQLNQVQTETCNQLVQNQTAQTCNQCKQTQTETCNERKHATTVESPRKPGQTKTVKSPGQYINERISKTCALPTQARSNVGSGRPTQARIAQCSGQIENKSNQTYEVIQAETDMASGQLEQVKSDLKGDKFEASQTDLRSSNNVQTLKVSDRLIQINNSYAIRKLALTSTGETFSRELTFLATSQNVQAEQSIGRQENKTAKTCDLIKQARTVGQAGQSTNTKHAPTSGQEYDQIAQTSGQPVSENLNPSDETVAENIITSVTKCTESLNVPHNVSDTCHQPNNFNQLTPPEKCKKLKISDRLKPLSKPARAISKSPDVPASNELCSDLNFPYSNNQASVVQEQIGNASTDMAAKLPYSNNQASVVQEQIGNASTDMAAKLPYSNNQASVVQEQIGNASTDMAAKLPYSNNQASVVQEQIGNASTDMAAKLPYSNNQASVVQEQIGNASTDMAAKLPYSNNQASVVQEQIGNASTDMAAKLPYSNNQASVVQEQIGNASTDMAAKLPYSNNQASVVQEQIGNASTDMAAKLRNKILFEGATHDGKSLVNHQNEATHIRSSETNTRLQRDAKEVTSRTQSQLFRPTVNISYFEQSRPDTIENEPKSLYPDPNTINSEYTTSIQSSDLASAQMPNGSQNSQYTNQPLTVELNRSQLSETSFLNQETNTCYQPFDNLRILIPPTFNIGSRRQHQHLEETNSGNQDPDKSKVSRLKDLPSHGLQILKRPNQFSAVISRPTMCPEVDIPRKMSKASTDQDPEVLNNRKHTMKTSHKLNDQCQKSHKKKANKLRVRIDSANSIGMDDMDGLFGDDPVTPPSGRCSPLEEFKFIPIVLEPVNTDANLTFESKLCCGGPFGVRRFEKKEETLWDSQIIDNMILQHTGIWSHNERNIWSSNFNFGDSESILSRPSMYWGQPATWSKTQLNPAAPAFNMYAKSARNKQQSMHNEAQPIQSEVISLPYQRQQPLLPTPELRQVRGTGMGSDIRQMGYQNISGMGLLPRYNPAHNDQFIPQMNHAAYPRYGPAAMPRYSQDVNVSHAHNLAHQYGNSQLQSEDSGTNWVDVNQFRANHIRPGQNQLPPRYQQLRRWPSIED